MRSSGLGIGLELADQGVIDLGGEQVIEHVHGGGEQDALIGLAGAPADDLGQEGFADARISDEDDSGAVGEKGEIEQAQDAIFVLQAALVMMEVEASMEGWACKRARRKRRSMARVARFQFKVEQSLPEFPRR